MAQNSLDEPKEGSGNGQAKELAKDWTPETAEKVIKSINQLFSEGIDQLAEKYIAYRREESEAQNKYLETATKHNTTLTLVLAAFLAVIVGLMSWLTILNRVSGDALLFLVGTITGYIILFIQRLIFGMTAHESTPEE